MTMATRLPSWYVRLARCTTHSMPSADPPILWWGQYPRGWWLLSLVVCPTANHTVNVLSPARGQPYHGHTASGHAVMLEKTRG